LSKKSFGFLPEGSVKRLQKVIVFVLFTGHCDKLGILSVPPTLDDLPVVYNEEGRGKKMPFFHLV
jgi:hypothetical protein